MRDPFTQCDLKMSEETEEFKQVRKEEESPRATIQGPACGGKAGQGRAPLGSWQKQVSHDLPDPSGSGICEISSEVTGNPWAPCRARLGQSGAPCTELRNWCCLKIFSLQFLVNPFYDEEKKKHIKNTVM